MSWVWLGLWIGTVAAAALLRSRLYAAYSAFMLGIQSLVWASLFADGSWISRVAFAFSVLVFVHHLALIRPSMRSFVYRLLVSWPALWFAAGTMLAAPWAFASALGISPIGWWLPWVVALVGMAQSLRHRREVVDLVLSDEVLAHEVRVPEGSGEGRSLRVAHITDTHLGPFVSEKRLFDALTHVVEEDPDLVLLTGDFMTMESSGDPEMVARAFAPLASISDRVFACHGNHDLEAPDVIQSALGRHGIRILVDELAAVETPVGRVELVGFDFRFREAREHIEGVCADLPRSPDTPRIALLHHPGYFKFVPPGEADLVLSGHTHGGQLGLVDFGINISLFSVFVRCPDHGFWGLGPNRLYVGRGLGHYGFPLRIGVSGHQAILNVYLKG